jgi:hypothetical protein
MRAPAPTDRAENRFQELVALLPARLKPRFNQPASSPLALVTWQYGHRGKRQGVHRSTFSNDGQSAEQDVADDLTAHFGHQGHLDVAAVPEGIDEIGFAVLTKGRPVHVPDAVVILLGLWSNRDAQGTFLQSGASNPLHATRPRTSGSATINSVAMGPSNRDSSHQRRPLRPLAWAKPALISDNVPQPTKKSGRPAMAISSRNVFPYYSSHDSGYWAGF